MREAILYSLVFTLMDTVFGLALYLA